MRFASLLCVGWALTIPSSTEAQLEGGVHGLGQLALETPHAGVVEVGQALEWTVELVMPGLVQFATRASDSTVVELRDPDGEVAAPLGQPVDGTRRWTAYRVRRPGTWRVRLANHAASPVRIEVEWALNAPWPLRGNDAELPLSLFEQGDRSAARGAWHLAESRFAAAVATGTVLLGDSWRESPAWSSRRNRIRWTIAQGSRVSALDLAGEARRAWLARQPEEAIARLSDAIGMVEQWAGWDLGDERVTASIWQQAADYTHRLVGWHMTQGSVSEAFLAAERTRARAHLEQVRAPEAFRSDSELEATRDSLLQVRGELLDRRGAARTDSATATIDEALTLVEAAFGSAYSQLRTTSILEPRMAPPTPTLPEIQARAVPEGGLLLLYQLGPPSSYVFVVPPAGDTVEAFALEGGVNSDWTALICPTCEETRGAKPLEVSTSPGNSFAEVAEALSDAWQTLVPSAIRERVLTATEVVVVPHGSLAHMPFDALIVEEAADLKATRFWLDQGPPIRYAPSATTLVALEQRTRESEPAARAPRFVSVFNPVYGHSGWSGGLPRLPGTEEEGRRVLAAFDGVSGSVEALADSAATEPSVRRVLESAQVAHLATHGLVRGHWDGLFAALALTPGPGTFTPAADGFLQLHEIYGLDLRGLDLVVLSACSTNIGSVWGDGVFALSSGFLAAGARQVVTTQWTVDDLSTSTLIGSMFDELSNQGPPAAWNVARALHSAKKGLRESEEWGHPYFWAPFVTAGLP